MRANLIQIYIENCRETPIEGPHLFMESIRNPSLPRHIFAYMKSLGNPWADREEGHVLQLLEWSHQKQLKRVHMLALQSAVESYLKQLQIAVIEGVPDQPLERQ